MRKDCRAASAPPNIALTDKSHVYNTDLMQALELGSCSTAPKRSRWARAQDRKGIAGASAGLHRPRRAKFLKHSAGPLPSHGTTASVSRRHHQVAARCPGLLRTKEMSELPGNTPDQLGAPPQPDTDPPCPRYQTYSVPCLKRMGGVGCAGTTSRTTLIRR